MKKILIILFGVALVSVSLAIAGGIADEGSGGGEAMKLTSPEFGNNEFIPEKFTCRGKNINPALDISGIPAGTKSIALICYDPDAPRGDWVHWLIFNMPVISRIEEDSAPGKQGINDFGRDRYDGPCPPSGVHRYFFEVYALDTGFDLGDRVSRWQIEDAMKGHVLADAELVGLCKK